MYGSGRRRSEEFAQLAGKSQVIVPGTKRLRGYDLSDGSVIWECGGLSSNIVASPVAANGVVYAGSSYDTRAMLTKPLRVKDLFDTIAGIIPHFGVESPNPRTKTPMPTTRKRSDEDVFDQASALARVEGDRELLGKMIELFFAQYQKLLPEIRRSGEQGEGKSLERAAHKLKGSRGSFGASLAISAVHRLEMMGRDADYPQFGSALAELEHEVGRLQDALTQFQDEGATCAF
jgi:HPt (histidine-containing phosphotransfer) domain-containing protein